MSTGDCPSIFSQTALEHLDALFGFAMTLTRDQSRAEDLVQETYLRAVKSRHQFAPASNLKSWMFVIMRNAWLNQIRHERAAPRFIELDEQIEQAEGLAQPASDDPHVIYMRKLERSDICAAIDSLPRLYREIIVLRDIEGFSYRQIAGILGCPAGTVMSRLGRAREKLRGSLSRYRSVKTASAS
jgi:RNA polymerase sigma-70 factor (ECF subfamily)